MLGLEAAAALARREVKVTLVEGFDWLLPRQLDRAAGERLAKERSWRLASRWSVRPASWNWQGEDRVRGVAWSREQKRPADVVIISTGVRSNSYLARRAGLEVNSGVIVDHHLHTSDPGHFRRPATWRSIRAWFMAPGRPPSSRVPYQA